MLQQETFPGCKFSGFLLTQSGKMDGLSRLTQKQLGMSFSALYLSAFMLMALFWITAATERGIIALGFPVMNGVGVTEQPMHTVCGKHFLLFLFFFCI